MGVVTLDLNASVFAVFSQLTYEEERDTYLMDGTHTSRAGAELIVNTIINLLQDSPSLLKNLLK